MKARKDGYDTVAFTALESEPATTSPVEPHPHEPDDGLKALMANKRKMIDLVSSGGDFPEGRLFWQWHRCGSRRGRGEMRPSRSAGPGLLAYLIAVIKMFPLLPSGAGEIVLDGEEPSPGLADALGDERPPHGWRFSNAPNSRPDDGMFDLCIAESASKGRILQMIPHFIKGSQQLYPRSK